MLHSSPLDLSLLPRPFVSRWGNPLLNRYNILGSDLTIRPWKLVGITNVLDWIGHETTTCSASCAGPGTFSKSSSSSDISSTGGHLRI